MKRSLKLIIASFIVWFLIHTTVIIIDGLNDDNLRSDVGVIFGNKVNPDGSLSERLLKRCDKGIDLYHRQLIGLIVVSGGLGKEGHYEGTKMQEYLVDKGIPAEKIIVDNLGNTTEATAENVRKMNLNFGSVIVISQYHHISRAKLAFRNKGYAVVYGAHADYFEWRDLYSIAREFFAYYKYLLVG